jgi:hypothetical protein
MNITSQISHFTPELVRKNKLCLTNNGKVIQFSLYEKAGLNAIEKYARIDRQHAACASGSDKSEPKSEYLCEA